MPFDQPLDEPRIKYPRYGYLPDFYVCIIYLVLFVIAANAHLVLALRSRLWFLLPTIVVGTLGEAAGWVGRLWSNRNMSSKDAFRLQIITLIFSPTFLSAANFIIFGDIVRRLGAQYSWISARNYAIIFLAADISALFIQAAGGGIASGATTVHTTQSGSNLMLAGIILQLVAMIVYTLFAIDFVRRFLLNRPARKLAPVPVEMSAVERNVSGTYTSDEFAKDELRTRSDTTLDRKMKLMLCGLGLSTFFLIIRGIYRVAELADGWYGVIIETQVYFNVFDAAMVVLSLYSLIFLHPSYLLYDGPRSNLKGASSR